MDLKGDIAKLSETMCASLMRNIRGYTVECCFNAVQHNIIFAYATIITEEKYTSEGIFTKYTPYLALLGELWGVFCKDLGEYWPC